VVFDFSASDAMLSVLSGSQDEDSVKKLFPTDFHANLRSLLTKVIIDNSEKWKTTALANQSKLKNSLCGLLSSYHKLVNR